MTHDPERLFSGKTALVTGGAKRIGRAIVLALAKLGANVVIHYGTSAEEAETTATDARTFNVRTWTVSCDLTQTGAASSMFKKALETSGSIDFLVNNASVFTESTLGTLDTDTIRDVLTLHMSSPLELTAVLAEHTDTGAVVNILDNRIFRIDNAHPAYQLSKSMLADVTRMTAVEYSPGLRVNGVAPGMILPPPGMDETYLKHRAKQTLLGRHGTAKQIADTVVFLLSNDFITGEIISVDGGENLMRKTYRGCVDEL